MLVSEAGPARRKFATLLFCDMSGSTAMAERLDSEAVRELMFRYFHEMRAAIERHGGTVEKFIGDAVMAVFGVPVAHEDDALRALRAAAEMRDHLRVLNGELERRYGVTIALRIGVNTGKVVAGDPTSRETIVTGDAVNVAARLEQAAAPGEILLGDLTRRLAGPAADVEPVASLELKGKSQPVPAHRLRAVASDEHQPGRPVVAPMVGRDEELAFLGRTFEAARGTRSCRLVTVVGEPGVGKSRLAAELISALGREARVLRGRCLSYGEGITYWAIREIVREAAAIHDEQAPEEARARLAALLGDEADHELVTTRVAQAIGLAGGMAPAEELAWAIRRLLEALARGRALLLVVDDIHWAEPALLDLIADLPARSHGAPLLVLCLARPELLEARPGWPAHIRLEPLGQFDSRRLLASLLGGEGIGREARGRIARIAAGNPLFVEELVAMLVDEGVLQTEDGRWVLTRPLEEISIPTSISSLLGARLDRLPGDERAVLERGAIEGEVFHQGAVAALSESEVARRVKPLLDALGGRGLVRPARADFAGEAAFRFRHLLVREAAYAATTKRLRAELHERFAGWLETAAGERLAEVEEIVGYHLEQAYRFREELGPVGEEGMALAARAATRLASAGERAFNRGDMQATVNLLSRAVDLLPRRPDRLKLLPDLACALVEVGELDKADGLLSEAIEAGRSLGDSRLVARAQIEQIMVHLWTGKIRQRDGLTEAESAARVLENFGEDFALARAWHVVGLLRFWSGQAALAADAWERSLAAASHSGQRVGEVEALSWRLWANFVTGPGSVDTGIRACEETLKRGAEFGRVEAWAYITRGVLEAMRCRFEEARELLDRGRSVLEDRGLKLLVGGVGQAYYDVEMLADNPTAAGEHVRAAYETLEQMGEAGYLVTTAAMLAEAMYIRQRLDEAMRLADVCRENADEDDIDAQVRWRSIRAKVLAKRGQFDEALSLARDAVALAETTDFLPLRGDTLMAHAEVARRAGKRRPAVASIEAAINLYEQKGNVASARKARSMLRQLAGSIAEPGVSAKG
jgi:class 3 adenylate cyclase/tetratricopeptide (TPR) repeat protein